MINQKFRQRFGKKKCICFDDREKEYRDLRKGDRKKVEKKKKMKWTESSEKC